MGVLRDAALFMALIFAGGTFAAAAVENYIGITIGTIGFISASIIMFNDERK